MSQQRSIIVRTPSRLHFGLLGFGNTDVRQFGGVGVMVDRPGIELSMQANDSFQISVAPGNAPELAERIQIAATRWAKTYAHEGDVKCRIELRQVPRLHAGLGVGTQLALGVAAGLNSLFDRECNSAEELARSVGRGLRSAVGTYGFVSGGLIAEQGKLATDTVSPLIERIALQEDWRFVLITPPEACGLHGANEQSAFDKLPPVPATTTDQLTSMMNDRIMPAAKAGNFADFSGAIFEFGHLAGSCFEPIQGSAYNGPVLTQIVKRLRDHGVRGVGQSSWGPTIFAICNSEIEANELIETVRSEQWCADNEVVVAKPNNYGVTVTTETCGR